ncbi:MAG: 6-phosphogluconolactonase [Desulfomonile tiedjei]|nr:6-phosphogluconolactonase [Desulfomonile tiedjei]
MTIRVFSDTEELSKAAADLFVQSSRDAVAAKGRFSVALSGGGSPRETHRMLAQSPHREKVPWEKVHVFWGDERCVAPGDPRHNATTAFEDMLNHVPVKTNHIHAISCNESPGTAAEAYDSLLRDFFKDTPTSFDLIFLGLGQDGHTASLFPHNPVLDEKERWAKEVFVPEQRMYRVTLTAAVINRADYVVFLVYGDGKSQVLRDVLEGPHAPQLLPAQLIRPAKGKLLWLVDESAASKLTTIPPKG